MDNLLEQINDYYLNHGYYPKVKVSREFAANNLHDMYKLVTDDGVVSEID